MTVVGSMVSVGDRKPAGRCNALHDLEDIPQRLRQTVRLLAETIEEAVQLWAV
jgi:hypothetical protein